MFDFMASKGRTTSPATLGRSGILALVAALALGACGGSASNGPTNGPDGPDGTGGATSTPGAASQGPGDTGGPDGGTAFSAATAALAALDSYAFKVEIQSKTSHTVMSGVVENKPDKATSLQQAELDATGKTTSSTGSRAA